MAGGKETPRQKMIGMMYLVLTALLALNVSKQILDAFVAIEENTQKANITHHDRGIGAILELKSALSEAKGPEDGEKRKKIQYYLGMIDKIDKETGKMVQFIDELKVEILKESGEDVAQGQMNDETKIIWSKFDSKLPCLPIRMNLMAVQAKDQYDVPMHVLIGEDIKTPKGKGLELWEKFNKYRSDLVSLVGTYNIGGKAWSIKPKAINTFKDHKDLQGQVNKMIESSKANLNDDGEVLKQIYLELTKPEKVVSGETKDAHWIGKTFDHSPLVAAVASLSSLQQDILAARATALSHIKGKVSTGEYSFNKVMALAYAPAVANNGDDIEVKVMMAAFDTDNQPIVTYGGKTITEVTEGQGIVKTKASGSGEMNLSGTVSIRKKSGDMKTEKWETKVVIMKPQGTVSLPDMRVLYQGYSNTVEAVASGYDQTMVSGQGVTLSKSGQQWIANPGGGKSCKITVSGKSSVTNKTTSLGTFEFQIRKMPKAEIFWGQAADGEKGVRTAKMLYAKYGEGIPLTKAKFEVASWVMTIPGAPKSIQGSGSQISAEASRYINAAPAGTVVSFSCVYNGTGVRNKVATSSFKL